jgi:winged helix DNA-binding protein
MDLDPLLAFGQRLVDEQPRSNAELRPILGKRWPDRDSESLAQAVRYLLPLVQVPPRGLWGTSGQARHTSAESWLRRRLSRKVSPDAMVLRYLAAFGPATVADARTWSGLTGLRGVFEALRPRLRTFRDERDRELFDVPEGALPDSDTPASPRFLPYYDNVLLAHADRSRVISDERRRLATQSPNETLGTVLVDGFVGAIWRISRAAGAVTLRVTPIERLPPRDRDAVAAEGARLLAFLGADATSREVQITAPPTR